MRGNVTVLAQDGAFRGPGTTRRRGTISFGEAIARIACREGPAGLPFYGEGVLSFAETDPSPVITRLRLTHLHK